MIQARQDTRRDSDFSVRKFLERHRVEVDVNCSHLLQYTRSLPGFRYLTVYDFETSGLGKEAEIVEVGMMVFDTKRDRPICFSGLVNPGKPICLSATEVHGITDSDVRGSPKWEHSWGPVFSHLILDLKSAMTGWNNRAFDRHRLREKGISCPEGREFDLMSYWRASPKKKSTGLESNKLATVASYLQVQAPTHRALADVVAVAEIANALCKEGYDIFGDRPRKPRCCPLTQSLFDRADQVSSAAR